ncbi:MAG TPA: DUF692 family protein [Leptospiraceae bacterium]|nr:DUF692 family protein [Leptospiraceae bacterium]
MDAEAAVAAEGTEVRIGLGWRNEISSAILKHLDRIEILEVIIDDYLDFSRKDIQLLKFISSQSPVTLHGIELGLASTIPIEEKRLARFAKLIHLIRPEYWSEHIAFVRGLGVELHHLGAPPRNLNTFEGLLANLEKTEKIIGISPSMENPASPVDPPGSRFTHTEWIQKISETVENRILLDLHNLYADSVNFGFDPKQFILSIPHGKIGTVHIAGGRRIGNTVLDTHRHSVPEQVYELLEFTSSVHRNGFDVILERDGNYPEFSQILNELQRARESVQRGRSIHELSEV